MTDSSPDKNFYLNTLNTISPVVYDGVGRIHVVKKESFKALEGITSYVVEIWEECMRLPHWHPNACELGYVVSGEIEIIIWRTPGETAVFTLSAGMCWFIPKAALHSLNNVGEKKVVLLVGFSDSSPADIDLPVAFNGIPVPIRNAITSPHEALRQWQGPADNPLVGRCPVDLAINQVITGSPYGFDLAKVTPLFEEEDKGSVVWAIKDNWKILEDISMLRARLKPNMARDPIWYPDAGTLYIVTKGKAEFSIINAGCDCTPFQVSQFDFIYVPTGVLHTFVNLALEDFEVIAFFTQADPTPEVSLAVSTAFFPNIVRRASMTQYGSESIPGDPLKHLKYSEKSPYIIPIKK